MITAHPIRNGCRERRLWRSAPRCVRPECHRGHSVQRWRIYPAWLLAIAVVALLGFPPESAQAIEFDENNIVWGFDGTVVKNRFNLLSVLVRNPSPEPFEGLLTLRKATAGGQTVGAPLEEPVFVSPFASRWVQLYPYVLGDWETWTLTLTPGPSPPGRGGRGEGTQRLELTKPRLGEPARVILESADELSRRGGSLKRFPENLFPPLATATDGLRSVVLDHVPRWEQARREAFLDWLRRGGSVHVIHGSNGRFPRFPETLSELNSPLDVHRLGAGVVFRHPRPRTELDPEFVQTAIVEEAMLDNRRTGPAGEEFPIERPARADADANSNNFNYADWQSDETFFSHLKQMTRATHNWIVIHVMSLIYVLLIFPGCYLFGQKHPDYRKIFGVLLGIIALFSLVFHVVGRRGYGERTAVNTVALARPVSQGVYDVTGWSNVFVTGGDYYEITHGGRGQIYSTCQQLEVVNGAIRNGIQGRFVVDIPPFSSRTFAHRAQLKAPAVELIVQQWQAQDRLESLTLSLGDRFPKQAERIYALYRNRFYKMSRDGDRLRLETNVGSAVGFLRLDQYNRLQRFGPFWGGADDDKTDQERFRSLFEPLLARHLGLTTHEDVQSFSLPPDRVKLFVYAPMPEEFFVRNDRLGRQTGYVLYCFDLFQPGTL